MLALAWFAGNTLPHEVFSNSVYAPLRQLVGATRMEWLCGLFFFACLPLVGWWGRRAHRVPACPGFSSLGLVWRGLLLAGLAVTGWGVLLVTNIELIHYVQYMVLAVLLRLGGLAPSTAWLLVLVGNGADEARQYLLHPRFTGYLDWNDLVINAVGAAMGLLAAHRLPVAVDAAAERRNARLRAMACTVLTVVAAGLGLGLLRGWVVPYVGLPAGTAATAFPTVGGQPVLALALHRYDQWWTSGPLERQVHIMGVAEGAVVTVLTAWALWLIIRPARPAPAAQFTRMRSLVLWAGVTLGAATLGLMPVSAVAARADSLAPPGLDAAAQAADTVLTARRALSPLTVDGRPDEAAWKQAHWTSAFMDMVDGSAPWLHTETALLWDDAGLYVAARMQEPYLEATVTARDGQVYRDPDFEFFVAGQNGYWEFEINAAGTVYDVFWVWQDAAGLAAYPDTAWNPQNRHIMRLSGIGSHVHPRGERIGYIDHDVAGLQAAVHRSGTLNAAEDVDTGWSLEFFVPWSVFALLADGRPVPPHPDDTWRMNLSRFVFRDAGGQRLPIMRPAGWTLTRHGAFDSHMPEHFASVRFVGAASVAVPPAAAPSAPGAQPDGRALAPLLRALQDGLCAVDALTIPTSELEDHVRRTLHAVEAAPWRAELTPELVRDVVLPLRVTEEPYVPWHGPLREQLLPHMEGATGIMDAAARIRQWLNTRVRPGSSAPWDMDALTLLRAGQGRCEELGILFVCAARAMAVPARIAYVPAWRDADGNHLWVEVWDGAQWQPFSVEQPAAPPGQSWFAPHAARAPLVLAVEANPLAGRPVASPEPKSEPLFEPAGQDDPSQPRPQPFAQAPARPLAGAAVREPLFDRRGPTVRLNRTAAYARTGQLQVEVQDEAGAACAATVRVGLVNNAHPRPLLTRQTSRRMTEQVGTGTYLVWAMAGPASAAAPSMGTVASTAKPRAMTDMLEHALSGAFSGQSPTDMAGALLDGMGQRRGAASSVPADPPALRPRMAWGVVTVRADVPGVLRLTLRPVDRNGLPDFSPLRETVEQDAGLSLPEPLPAAFVAPGAAAAPPDPKGRDAAALDPQEEQAEARMARQVASMLWSGRTDTPAFRALLAAHVWPGRVDTEPFSHWRRAMRARLPTATAPGDPLETARRVNAWTASLVQHPVRGGGPDMSVVQVVRTGRVISQADAVVSAVAALRAAGLPARLPPEQDAPGWVEWFDGAAWQPFYPRTPEALGKRDFIPEAARYYSPRGTLPLPLKVADYGRSWSVCRLLPNGALVPLSESAVAGPAVATLTAPVGSYILTRAERQAQGGVRYRMQALRVNPAGAADLPLVLPPLDAPAQAPAARWPSAPAPGAENTH